MNEAIHNRFPGRVISNSPAYRAVSGGFHYLRAMDQSDSHIRLALGRKIGLAVTEKKVHSLFNEDSVPLRVTNFIIELRGPSETKFKSALYEILSSSNSKVYELSDCQLIRFITYNLPRGHSSDRYKVSFTLKDINTIRFQCKNAETGEVVVSEEDLIVLLCLLCNVTQVITAGVYFVSEHSISQHIHNEQWQYLGICRQHG